MRLVLTKRAEHSFNSIKTYINDSFGVVSANTFEQDIVDFLQILKLFPQIGSLQIKNKQIRAFQLKKLTTIFYRLKDQDIIILTFFDVRQNPKKKPK